MICFLIGYLVLVVLVQFIEAIPEFIVKIVMFPFLPVIAMIQLWKEGRNTLVIIFSSIILLLLSILVLLLCIVK
jgi:hypothetical protein